MEFIIYDRVPKSFTSFDYEAETRSPVVALAMFAEDANRLITTIHCYFFDPTERKPYGDYLVAAKCSGDFLICSNCKKSRIEDSFFWLEQLV